MDGIPEGQDNEADDEIINWSKIIQRQLITKRLTIPLNVLEIITYYVAVVNLVLQ